MPIILYIGLAKTTQKDWKHVGISAIANTKILSHVGYEECRGIVGEAICSLHLFPCNGKAVNTQKVELHLFEK